MNRHALLTPEEMGRADAAAIAAGRSGEALMLAAGRAVAEAVRRRFSPRRTLVLAGPGNNGGDGYVLARLLEQAGWPVAMAPLAPPRPGSDAAAAAARWRGPVVPFAAAEVGRAALVVDALFGAGLSRPLSGDVAQLLRSVRAPLVAVDIPSGVDGATGGILGYAPQAALTVTFFRRKPGHLLLPGRDLCGETVLAEIGLPDTVLEAIAPRAFGNAPGLWRPPLRDSGSHKFSRGHVTIPCGAALPGAARLAAGAARRAGAGLVSLATDDAATAAILRGGEPGLMVTTEAVEHLLEDRRRDPWLLGPGLPPDDATRALLRRVTGAGRMVVADGGALTACAGDPAGLQGAAILTPHAGEFLRVFGDPGDDRLAAARKAADVTGAVILLKGSDSIIAAPDGRAAINHNAPPALATAGSGDVLAGLAAGLLGQGMGAFDAACAAAWLHGDAAQRALAGQPAGSPLLPEDLFPEIGKSLASALPSSP
ncbi:bifunctional ADP-dependent (S)-NAD(P)H-hydrate dehydratase/NAD(P)H-hydrate epimerase [Pseudoroseomonas deserti]|uniref:Bifunctional NAD(P)H-hydrate repair enzyme n=1 Tax=Teichococcus deserti TaxID=1817963 RepID=A0A1V2H4J8_9PROT|nr:bifunctional ADP-dependent NAD(P)H-hydrate dehydratase/NAD(P)H-hydrate epimerase [Pseudoroseomonas deserti]ONG55488.1 bifunctional ADP-dependent (S)-NAD(P)H-hydrate dehydratase/NAD(P)H-hydrate epimerase [Pseudoroseomonas deserti]